MFTVFFVHMDCSSVDIFDYLVVLKVQNPGEKACSQDLLKMFATLKAKFSKTDLIFLRFSFFR